MPIFYKEHCQKCINNNKSETPLCYKCKKGKKNNKGNKGKIRIKNNYSLN